MLRGTSRGNSWAIVARERPPPPLPSDVAICERTLLARRADDAVRARGRDFVDVCPLCQEIAAEQGWVERGQPDDADLRGRASAQGSASRRSRSEADCDEETVVRSRSCAGSPITSAMVEAADLFNAEPVPAHGRRDRQEPGQAREHRPALGRQQGGRRHRRLGHLLDRYRVLPIGAARPVGRARPRAGRARAVVPAVERAVDPDGRLVPEIAGVL